MRELDAFLGRSSARPLPSKASVPESGQVFIGAGTCPAGSILPEGSRAGTALSGPGLVSLRARLGGTGGAQSGLWARPPDACCRAGVVPGLARLKCPIFASWLGECMPGCRLGVVGHVTGPLAPLFVTVGCC